MTNLSDSDAEPGDAPAASEPPTPPAGPPTPKRGAFPTPESELEKATPYTPDVGDVDDSPDDEGPPADKCRPSEGG